MDQQQCGEYGFTAGTDAFAQCMMGISQQRAAQEAADRRQQDMNAAIAEQARRDRDAQAARDAANRSAQTTPTSAETSSDSGIPKIDVPKIDAPEISIPAGLKCTSVTNASGNAGSMTCSN